MNVLDIVSLIKVNNVLEFEFEIIIYVVAEAD